MPYQRATSPIIFEPLSPSPSDIVLEEPESDNDEQSRTAKRRRIEKLAEAYLAGEPLYIMTASLKGPFGPDWKNPWRRKKKKKKKEKKKEKEKAEVLETVQKSRLDAPMSSKPYQPVAEMEKPKEKVRDLTSTADRDGVEFSAVSVAIDEFVKTHTPPKSASRSNTDWLRRNESHLRRKQGRNDRTPSPTPLSRPTRSHHLHVLRQPFPNEVPGHTPEIVPDCARSAPVHANTTLSLLPENETSLEREQGNTIPVPGKTQDVVAVPQRSSDEREYPTKNDLRHAPPSRQRRGTSKTGNSANNKAISDMMRREVRSADLRNPKGHKRRSLHTLPPSSNLPAFEYRPSRSKSRSTVSLPLDQRSPKASQSNNKHGEFKKPSKRVSFYSSTDPKTSKKPLAPQTESTRDQLMSAAHAETAREIPQLPENAPVTSSVARSHSTTVPEESTGIGSTADFPSAQVIDAALDPPVQNISAEPIGSNPLFPHPFDIPGEEDSILQLSTQAAVTRAQLCFQEDLITPIKHISPPTNATVHTSQRTSVYPPQTTEHLSTQAMIDNITPFIFSTAKRTKPTASTPCHANSKAAGSKLRTSWTHSSPLILRKPFPPSSHSAQDHYESAQSTSSKIQPPITSSGEHSSAVNVPLSLPSHQPSIPCPGTATTTSTSVHQDAQPQQELGFDGMDFDLDETLEDIGSYLQGWSVESEMRSGALRDTI